MPTRRAFVKLTAMAPLLGVARAAGGSMSKTTAGSAEFGTPQGDRAYWCDVATRLSGPLLPALAERRLKQTMPIEAHATSTDRVEYSHLEALGRLLAGMAPWLELGADVTEEGRERGRLAELARAAIDAATDPVSPDFLNFSRGGQPLVDTAFLAQALLRAPTQLWGRLDPRVQKNVVAAMKTSRAILPGESNWKLFATMVEVFLQYAGETTDDRRLFEGLAKHRAWYVGDGTYGDGPGFHWDYYNSFVIQPMLVESLEHVSADGNEWLPFRDLARQRLTRWATVQERQIAPDGSYPVIGRSIAYRCGAFQGLALSALQERLPAEVSPGQARVALTRVIRRTLEAPETFDEQGWLRIGLAGHQPSLGERYISTGSLYLCSVALLPLGLAPSSAFWTDAPRKTTWEKAWAGEDVPADHALTEHK